MSARPPAFTDGRGKEGVPAARWRGKGTAIVFRAAVLHNGALKGPYDDGMPRRVPTAPYMASLLDAQG